MATITGKYKVSDSPAAQPHPGVAEVTLTAFSEGGDSAPVGTITVTLTDAAQIAALLPGTVCDVTITVPDPAPVSGGKKGKGAATDTSSTDTSSDGGQG